MLGFVEIIVALTCFVTVKVPYTLLIKDQMFHERRHIDVKYRYVQDIIAQGKLKVCSISTHDNPVGCEKFV
jgi:hypothetical protein